MMEGEKVLIQHLWMKHFAQTDRWVDTFWRKLELSWISSLASSASASLTDQKQQKHVNESSFSAFPTVLMFSLCDETHSSMTSCHHLRFSGLFEFTRH